MQWHNRFIKLTNELGHHPEDSRLIDAFDQQDAFYFSVIISAEFEKMQIDLDPLPPQVVDTLPEIHNKIAEVYKEWCYGNMKLPDSVGFVNWRKRYISMAVELKGYPEAQGLNKFFDLSDDDYEKAMKPSKSRSEDSPHKFRAV